jgi:riboflavin kinase/FMN adenylyltransferase
MTDTISGTVIRGRGRLLGIPTANIAPENGTLEVEGGIYAARVKLRGAEYPAAVSVGANITFNETARTIEACILDFADDIVGERVELTFIARLRSMERFATVEALKVAIEQDIAQVRRMMTA